MPNCHPGLSTANFSKWHLRSGFQAKSLCLAEHGEVHMEPSVCMYTYVYISTYMNVSECIRTYTCSMLMCVCL